MGTGSSKIIKLTARERELLYNEHVRTNIPNLVGKGNYTSVEIERLLEQFKAEQANLEKAILSRLMPNLNRMILTNLRQTNRDEANFFIKIKRTFASQTELDLIFFKALIQELDLNHKWILKIDKFNSVREKSNEICLELNSNGQYQHYMLTVSPSIRNYQDFLISDYQTLMPEDYPKCLVCDQAPQIYDYCWGFYCLYCAKKSPQEHVRSNPQLKFKLEQVFDKKYYHFGLQFQIMLELGMLKNLENIASTESIEISEPIIYLENECVICYERTPAGVFRNCRHACLCQECQELYNLTKCPLCQFENERWDHLDNLPINLPINSPNSVDLIELFDYSTT